MIRHLAKKDEQGYDWIDIGAPEKSELHEIARRYGLHEALVNDCLQPGHLPKHESLDAYSFIIFRVFMEDNVLEADTVQELTNKVAIFYSDTFIITIHRLEQEFLEAFVKRVHTMRTTQQLLNAVIKACLTTYDSPANRLAETIDIYEEQVFLHNGVAHLLKRLYYLRRKIDLLRRMLLLSRDTIENVDNDPGNVNTRDTRDLYVKLSTIYDSLNDNINQLITVYFSTSSQRTNETMRILTIFSVFFMPLTFIVGVYGMNFKFMPELNYTWGYPAVMVLMVIITTGIYLWFKRKGWL